MGDRLEGQQSPAHHTDKDREAIPDPFLPAHPNLDRRPRNDSILYHVRHLECTLTSLQELRGSRSRRGDDENCDSSWHFPPLLRNAMAWLLFDAARDDARDPEAPVEAVSLVEKCQD